MAVYRGWEANLYRKVYFGSGGLSHNSWAVAQVEGWSMDVDTGAEAHFAMGSRTAVDISVGPKNVTGTLSRIWYDSLFSRSFADPDVKPSSFILVGYLKFASRLSVVANNVVLSTWGGAAEAEGAATEDVDFIARDVST